MREKELTLNKPAHTRALLRGHRDWRMEEKSFPLDPLPNVNKH